MHTRKVRRYFIVPVVYLAAIFGLLFLQFSGTLTVRRSIGNLRFTGTLISGADETSQQITGARIEYQGIVFQFSEEDPLVLANDEGQDTRLLPQYYEIEENELRVFFSDESMVRFEVASTDPPELHVFPTPTNQWPRFGRLLLPYRVAPTAHASAVNPASPETQTVEFEQRSYFFSTPPRTTFDQAQGRLIIPLSSSSQMVRYAQMSEERANVIEAAFGNNQREVSTAAYQNAIDEYLETGYETWGGARFNGGSGTWDMRDQAPRFSEEILTAYLAEAWRRNEYTTAFNQMRRAADLHPEQVGLLSSVFLGNLRPVTDRFVSSDEQRTLALASRLRASDPTVFREEDLLSFAALRGSESLYQQVVSFARDVDYRTVDLPTAVGMLSAAVDQIHPSAAATEATERFLVIVEERILPAVRQFEDFFFLETAQGEIEVYWSIRAGQLLNEVGRRQGDQLLRTVGRNLVLSGLQLADPQGFIPEFLFFGDAGIQGRESSFGPERLYTVFSDNPWYPRMRPMYSALGAGSFVWSIADFTEFDLGAETFQFRVRSPANRTHYMVFHGIPDFESMLLFGLQWRNDPRFESYIKGRHYDPNTNTLMIKYTDDTVEEDIALFF